MKKRLIALLFAGCLMLTGCSMDTIEAARQAVEKGAESVREYLDGDDQQELNREEYLSGTQDEQADELMGKITEAMDNKDADALKELFSAYAIEVTPDLDDRISELFDFYEGPSVSYDGKSDYAEGSTSYEPNESGYGGTTGHAYWLLGGSYTLTTVDETYQVNIVFYTVNEEKPEKVGLSFLEIVTQDYFDQDGFMMKSPDAAPGIYYYGNAGDSLYDSGQASPLGFDATSEALSAFVMEAFGENATVTDGSESSSWTFQDCINRIGSEQNSIYYGRDDMVYYTWKAVDNEDVMLRLCFADTDDDGIYTLYTYESSNLGFE